MARNSSQRHHPTTFGKMASRDVTVQGPKTIYELNPQGQPTKLYLALTDRVKRSQFSVINAFNGDYVNATPHAYNKVVSEFSIGTHDWYQNTPYIRYRSYGSLDSEFPLNFDESGAPSASSVYNDCVNRVYDRIRKSDANLAIDLAERKQTQQMIGKAWKALDKVEQFAGRAKKAQKKGMTLIEAEHAIGNAWLSYIYGWRPLLQTIYTLATFERSKLGRFPVVASAKRVVVKDGFLAGTSGAPQARWQDELSQRCRIGMWYRVSDPNLFDLTRITSLNPLAIAWELVPYSFVADWFFDLGGYMSAWEASAFAGLVFERGYRTDTFRYTTRGRYLGRYQPTGYTHGPFSADVKFKRVRSSLGRAKLLSPPRPEVPHLELKLGWQRCLSASALLHQILAPDARSLK